MTQMSRSNTFPQDLSCGRPLAKNNYLCQEIHAKIETKYGKYEDLNVLTSEPAMLITAAIIISVTSLLGPSISFLNSPTHSIDSLIARKDVVFLF
jgi:hypothetical protein